MKKLIRKLFKPLGHRLERDPLPHYTSGWKVLMRFLCLKAGVIPSEGDEAGPPPEKEKENPK